MNRSLLFVASIVAITACDSGETASPDGGTRMDASASDGGGGTDAAGLDAMPEDAEPMDAAIDAGADAGVCTEIAPRPVSVIDGAAGPKLASDGSGYGIVWADPRDNAGAGMDDEIYFVRMDANGARIGEDVRVTNAGGNVAGIGFDWNGSAYGLAFNDTRTAIGLYYTELDATGAKAFDEIRIGDLSAPPAVASGATFGVAWVSGSNVVLTRQLGSSVGQTSTIAMGLNPAIARGAGGWGVAFHDADRVRFARVDDSGVVGTVMPVSDGTGIRADITAGPDGFGVAWVTSLSDRDVRFARLDANGARIGAEIPLTADALDQGLPVVAAGYGGYAVAWTTADDELIAVFVTDTGFVSDPTPISNSALHMAFRPLDLIFDGERFVIVWTDTRNGANQTFLATYCP